MATINRSTLEGVFERFTAIANNDFGAAVALLPNLVALGIAMDVPTEQLDETYNFLDRFPAMRKWLGERWLKNLRGNAFTISNDPYEATIAIDRRNIEADRLNLYRPQIQLLSREAARHPIELAAAVLIAADSTLSADGQYLVDTDHEGDAGASQANKTSNSLTYTNAVAARAAVRQFTDFEGRNVGANPDILLVGPALEDAARVIVESEFIPNSANNDVNTLRNLKVVVLNEMGSSTKWFLMDSKLPGKALIWQHRVVGRFESVTDPSDSHVFRQREFLFGAEGDYTYGAGFWQAIYGGGF